MIADPRVHEAVTFLLDRRPPTLQLAIATRAEPPLPVGRLRVRGELAEVRAADLRFTDAEAAALLNDALALGLDADDVARLHRRTEGWAAGLRLAALSLAGREDRRAFISSFAGDDRPVVDYLGFEVLDGQPPEVREFLLSTSILDRLCGPLCDRVTEGEGSAAMLDALERGGLLVLPLDTRREWYRYHHLLAGLLRHELARTRPEAVATLHRRAADWFRSAGAAAPPSATRSRAATWPARASSSPSTGTRTSSARRIATVAGWLDALGDEAVRGEASLCLTQAWIAVNTGRLDEVAAWIAAAERAAARTGAPGDPRTVAGDVGRGAPAWRC